RPHRRQGGTISEPSILFYGPGYSSCRRQRLAASVADVEHIHCFTLDGEQDAVNMRFPSVEQLPHFKGKPRILGSERATPRQCGECRNSVLESQKPLYAGVPGVLRQ